jgi:ABC-type Fe3+-siderophore transport system permease subunit
VFAFYFSKKSSKRSLSSTLEPRDFSHERFRYRSLDMLSFGDDTASGLGLLVGRTRVYALIIGVVLCAFAVSIVGTIGFIGLLAPHAARRLVGFRHFPLMVTSGLLGGLLLVAADFIGRVALAPKEIPSGLVVALIGAPYLLMLLRKI